MALVRKPASSVGEFIMLAPAFSPSLEHQNVPQQILPISFASPMFAPVPADKLGVQETGFVKAFLRKKLFCPVPKRTAQPFGKRHAKPHFGLEFLRYVTIKHLPE